MVYSKPLISVIPTSTAAVVSFSIKEKSATLKVISRVATYPSNTRLPSFVYEYLGYSEIVEETICSFLRPDF